MCLLYAASDRENRQLLKNLKSTIRIDASILMRDSNIIRYHYEKVGCKEWDNLAMEKFEDDTQYLDVDDIPCKGENSIYNKLDRVLCNGHRMSLFPQLEVELLPPMVSDQSPGLITIKESFNPGPNLFKFHSFWMKYAEFVDILKERLGH